MVDLKDIRENLKYQLINDPARKVAVAGQVWTCEGKAYKDHDCSGGFHMHEAFWTRKHIEKLSNQDKAYFFNEINCVLLCGSFHFRDGHSSAFRNWFAKIQLNRFEHAVIEWINNAPTLIKPDFNFDLSEYLEDLP